MVVAALVTLALRGDDASSPGLLSEVLSTPTTAFGGERAAPSVTIPMPPSTTLPAGVSGFAYPLAGACLPEHDRLLPGAPREYRRGMHEGVDFYGSENCASVGRDTEVLAAKAGTVIRADWAYQELTAETLAELMERVEREGGSSPDVTDAFRGRQVWIDHGGGVVTRYAHLNGVADGVVVGSEVEQGAPIAYVGESGTPESVTAPGTQVHLHFEIRIGDDFLGRGLEPAPVRALYEQAFASSP